MKDHTYKYNDFEMHLDERFVLIVDDDPDFAQSLGDILELNKYKYAIAKDSDEAIAAINNYKPQVALIDVRLGQNNGIKLLAHIQAHHNNILCIMITAYAAIEDAVHALQSGAYDYIRKPVSGKELLITLNRCYQKIKLEHEKEKAEEAVKERAKELEKANDILRAILETTRKITTTTHLPKFGPLLLQEFAQNMKANGGSFYLKKNGIFILLHSLDSGHAPPTLSLPLKEGSVFQYVISRNKPLLIDDINVAANINRSGWQGYKHPSFMVFPLSDATGEVMGIIALHDKVNPPFTTQDLYFGTLIASYTSETLHTLITQENLARSQARYRQLVETMNDGLIVLDAATSFLYVNDRFCDIVGYRRDELINKQASLFMDESSQIPFCRAIRKDERTNRTFEIIWIRKDGKRRTTIVSPQIMPEAACEGCDCFAVVTDITERKRSEEALRQQKYEADIRVKELNCLFGIASMMDKADISLSELFKRTTKIIPFALQYPEAACAAITIDNNEFSTDVCKHSKLCYEDKRINHGMLSHKISAFGREIGSIRVWYREQRPASDMGPFLHEEHRLIHTIADLLGSIIERRRSVDALERNLVKIQATMEGIVQAMAMMSELRDPYTAGHQRRVSKLATVIAEEMELSEQEIDATRFAGIIHDLGKIHVPAEILSKPGPIGQAEFNIIKTHPQVGHDILQQIEFPWPIATIVHQHHERLDGSGYPLGLRRNEIRIEARIICVADTVEAMASHRPYRAALGIDKALKEINANSGTLYDPQVVKVCTDLFTEKGFSFE